MAHEQMERENAEMRRLLIGAYTGQAAIHIVIDGGAAAVENPAGFPLSRRSTTASHRVDQIDKQPQRVLVPDFVIRVRRTEVVDVQPPRFEDISVSALVRRKLDRHAVQSFDVPRRQSRAARYQQLAEQKALPPFPLAPFFKPFLHLYREEWAGKNRDHTGEPHPDIGRSTVPKKRRWCRR